MLYKRDSNGLMQAHINKKQFLKDILGRLSNKLQPCLDEYKRLNDARDFAVGYWGLVRLLMPVVDTIGFVVYGTSDSFERGSKILKDIGVPYPYISWNIFRNCLLHGDEILNVINDEKEYMAGWELSIGGGHSKIKDGSVHIDLETLYYDLYRYIEELIEKSNDEDELVLGGIRFNNKSFKKHPDLLDEYEKLFSTI